MYEANEAFDMLASKQWLSITAEPGTTYYVEWSPKKMELVDTARGAAGIVGLQSFDFFNAASKGDLARVKALIDAKTDVNAAEPDGFTALMLASEKGHLEVVRALVDAKADVNAKLSYGITALMWAASRGHLEIVRALLDAKCDVNATTTNGFTALKLASTNGYPEVVQLLKSAGATGM
jgi:ankyrin repeat protein